MKILEFCLSKSLGGLELYAAKIGEHLQKKGAEVITCVPPCSRLAEMIEGEKLLLKSRIPYLDLFTGLSLLHFVKKNQIDILHLHQSQDLSYAAFVKTFYPKIKTVFTSHMESDRVKKDFFHRWVYGKIDLILTVTKRMREIFLTTLPIDPEHIRHLYLGVETPDLSQKQKLRQSFRDRNNIPENEFLILFPGRLDPQKGQELMIDAVSLLVKKGIFPQVFFIGTATGDVKNYQGFLENKVEKAGLQSCCIFYGFVKNIHEYYAAADLSVLATKQETFGLVLLEAMAWEVPVIGSRAGGVLEIIEHGKNGFLFESMNANDLAATIEKCFMNRENLPILGENARKTVKEKFRWDHHVDSLYSIMENFSH